MLKFKSLEELKSNKELQNMGRYEHQKVKLNGEIYNACTTNQQYEDIIWGKLYEIFEELNKEYELVIPSDDFSSEIRDVILEKLEDHGVRFVDVFDEY